MALSKIKLLTPFVAEQFIDYVKKGEKEVDIIKSLKIAPIAFERWIKKGKKDFDEHNMTLEAQFYDNLQFANVSIVKVLEAVLFRKGKQEYVQKTTKRTFDEKGNVVSRVEEEKTMPPDTQAAHIMLKAKSDEFSEKIALKVEDYDDVPNVPDDVDVNIWEEALKK